MTECCVQTDGGMMKTWCRPGGIMGPGVVAWASSALSTGWGKDMKLSWPLAQHWKALIADPVA